jgi:signal transduction histidine kinase
MSLTGRFSSLVLGLLGVVLVGYSTALYLSARAYLDRQVRDRLSAALAVLAAAAEVHAEGVEWEPQERVLPLGREGGAERLLWMVFDDRGRRVDHSRSLDEADLTEEWTPRLGEEDPPPRLVDRKGRAWRVARRVIRPAPAPASGSRAAASAGEVPPADPAEVFAPSLVVTAGVPLGPTEAALASLAGLLVALSAAIWGAAALLCRRLSRRALAPLARMAASARGLDAGDSGWSLEEAGTGDELDDLGRAFNDLLSRLRVAYERQSRFSRDASHQLRTPLTILTGQIEVALRRERVGEEYRRALQTALGRAVQLGQIVEALMFLGRAEADARLPESEPLELNGWVARHLEERATAGRPREVALRADGDGPLWIRAHPPLLGQMLDNLLENAEKYGGAGTLIRVETSREGDLAVLAVEDDGPGLPAEDLPRVFEPFYRSAEARRRGVSGTGLGLAVVRRIATAFGGSVVARSETGRGARFEVRWPMAEAPQDGPEASGGRPGRMAGPDWAVSDASGGPGGGGNATSR